jgi:hypothetical protein
MSSALVTARRGVGPWGMPRIGGARWAVRRLAVPLRLAHLGPNNPRLAARGKRSWRFSRSGRTFVAVVAAHLRRSRVDLYRRGTVCNFHTLLPTT